MIQGSIVAIVTPMQADGAIDKKAMHDLVNWHLQSKTDGIVVIGTTGEAPTITPEEQFELISDVVKQVAGRIPVIAGTGTNSTQTTIKYTQQAKKAGADACLIVTPYYNRPTQRGLYEHYKTVAANVDLPIILYNVPTRTGCDLLPETIQKLAQIPGIIGVKEASGKVERVTEIRQLCGPAFGIYCGNDDINVELIELGANGAISVTANIAPKEMAECCAAALSGNKTLATQLHQKLMPLHKKLFIEPNPIPTKWALHQMGKIATGIRLPLSQLDTQYHAEVKQAMRDAGIQS